MTSKSRFAVAVFLSVALHCRAADNKPDPAQLLQAVNEKTDLSRVLPHRMTGTVVLDPGAPDESSGTITIYCDQDQYRSELEIAGLWRIWLRLGNKIYIADSSRMAFLGLEKLKDLENAWRERRIATLKAKFNHESQKKAMSADAWCMDEEIRGHATLNLCLDAARQVMLGSGYGDDRYEFSEFQEFEGKLYPGRIRRLRRGQAVLEVRDLRATAGPVPENAFQIPQGARSFETCDDMVSPKTLASSPDILGTAAFRADAIRIFVYGIITEDGRFTQVEVASVPRNPRVAQSVKEAAEKRRYSPAMCGGKPVAVEQYIDIDTRRRY